MDSEEFIEEMIAEGLDADEAELADTIKVAMDYYSGEGFTQEIAVELVAQDLKITTPKVERYI